jgi:hypothetical protein
MRWMTLACVTALLVLSFGCGDPADTREPLDLQRVGTIWEFPGPDDRVIVDVRPDGTILIEGEVLDLDALSARIRSGAHSQTVVLRLDRALPWGVAEWVLRACVDQGADIGHVHVAVLPEKGKREGVLALRFRRERFGCQTPVEVNLRTFGKGSEPAALYERVHQLAHLDPTLTYVPDPENAVPTGYVLRVIDVLLRAGVREMGFHWVRPRHEPPDLVALSLRCRSKPVNPTIEMFEIVAGTGEIPPAPRERRKQGAEEGVLVLWDVWDPDPLDEGPPPIEDIPHIEPPDPAREGGERGK